MNNAGWLILGFLFGGAGLIAIFSILNLILPVPVDRARSVLETSLVRSLLLGLVNSLFAGLVIALLTLPTRAGGVIAGIFVFLIILIVLGLTALLLLGLVALTSLLAGRMDGAKSAFSGNLRGGILLVLACLTPYLGWFVITPLVLFTALGASIQTVLRSRRREVTSESTE